MVDGELSAAAEREGNPGEIRTIEAKAEEEPLRIRFAWDLARTKLEAYFDRNLSQVQSIFWVSVLVTIVGFGLIVYGVFRSINAPVAVTASYVAAISGIITEFIGLTLMVIYRSTLQQASSFMVVLEKINSVGRPCRSSIRFPMGKTS